MCVTRERRKKRPSAGLVGCHLLSAFGSFGTGEITDETTLGSYDTLVTVQFETFYQEDSALAPMMQGMTAAGGQESSSACCCCCCSARSSCPHGPPPPPPLGADETFFS